jgi:chemotaxis protein CheX
MMKTEDIKIFCDVVANYFQAVTSHPIEIGVPYVKADNFETLSLTGAIGISGVRKGCLFITATEAMIKELTSIILMSDEVDDVTLYDMVGELTNTIAGNVRQSFGPDFDISIPIIIKGKHIDIIMQKLKTPVYIVPIIWKEHKFFLNIGID